MVDLKANPYFLDESQVKWVRETLDAMNTEDKIGQLFCETLWNCTDEEEEVIFSEIKPGGVMFRPNPAEKIRDYTERLQAKSDIPLLIAANLERGGNGGITDGTYYGTQMQVAATDDDECGKRLGLVAGAEGGSRWI